MQKVTTGVAVSVSVSVMVEGVDYGAVFISRDGREERCRRHREGAVTVMKAGVSLPSPGMEEVGLAQGQRMNVEVEEMKYYNPTSRLVITQGANPQRANSSSGHYF